MRLYAIHDKLFSMEIRQISYFNEFRCLEGACSETCCTGWLIPLCDEDIIRYRDQKGLLKARLMLAMSEHSIPVFNSSCGECTFHGKNGLCTLQVKHGHEFIPETCRSYPRFYRNYGEFEERYLDLSCLEASNLLVRHAGQLSLSETDAPADCDKTYTNDDAGFLNTLLVIRRDMISALEGAVTLDELISVIDAIDAYAAALQNAYLHGRESYPDEHPFEAGQAGTLDGGINNACHIFPLKASEIDDIAHSSLYHVRLKKTNPRLYHLFNLYFMRYRRETGSENGWTAAYRELFAEYPDALTWFKTYYSYYLYQYWLKTYEDYSFLRNVRIGIIHASMLLMLTVMYVKKNRSLTADEFAHICTIYNRRAYFSDDLLDEMYRVLDKRNMIPFMPG